MSGTTIKERPILFAGPMVKAILEGRKTQTRRVVKTRSSDGGGELHPSLTAVEVGWFSPLPEEHAPKVFGAMFRATNGANQLVACPYGPPGDRLWVKETFAWDESEDGQDLIVYANGETWSVNRQDRGLCHKAKWKTKADRFAALRKVSSIHMPRWASRLTLEVVSVRVERVRDISEADAIAEGVLGIDIVPGVRSAKCCFLNLFFNLNERAPKDSNPFVRVVEFRRVKP